MWITYLSFQSAPKCTILLAEFYFFSSVSPPTSAIPPCTHHQHGLRRARGAKRPRFRESADIHPPPHCFCHTPAFKFLYKSQVWPIPRTRCLQCGPDRKASASPRLPPARRFSSILIKIKKCVSLRSGNFWCNLFLQWPLARPLATASAWNERRISNSIYFCEIRIF